jgi:hypothetical protein
MTMNHDTQGRRRFAGTVAAGSLLAAISAGIVAAWSVTDCIRFQTKPGECDDTMSANAPTFVAAVAAVAAAFGSWTMGYETLNPALSRRRKPSRPRGPDGRFLPSDDL